MELDLYQKDLKKLYTLSMAYEDALLPRHDSHLPLKDHEQLYHQLTVDALRYNKKAKGSLFRLLADQAKETIDNINNYSRNDLDKKLAVYQAQFGHAIAHLSGYSENPEKITWSKKKSFDPYAEESHINIATYLNNSCDVLGKQTIMPLIDNWAYNADKRIAAHNPDSEIKDLLLFNEEPRGTCLTIDIGNVFKSLLGLAISFFTAGPGATLVGIVSTWLIGTMVDTIMDIPTDGLWSIGRLAFELIGLFIYG